MNRVVLAVVVGLGCALLSVPDQVSAQTGPDAEGADAEPSQGEEAGAGTLLTRRAVIFLEAGEDVDQFVRVFVHEVVATALRDRGFAVARGDLVGRDESPMACLVRESCARALVASEEAPLILAMQIEASGERLTLRWRRSDAAEPDAQVLEGAEGEVATQLAMALGALDLEALPCVVVIDSALRVAVVVDGQPLATPGVIEAGEHRATVRSEGREPWNGPLQCTGGRVLSVRAR